MASQPLKDRLPDIRGSYRENALLSKTNWFNVGGPAEILFRPVDIDDLQHFLTHAPDDITSTILGVGSNLLVRDGGIDGVVIKLGKGFTHMTTKGHTICAGAGALSYNVALQAAHANIGSLEFLSGIPGTIGGALAMNAGAYGGDVSSVLIEAKAIDEKGDLHILSPSDIGYVYRGHTMPDHMVFVEGTFQGTPGNKDTILENMAQITQQREDTQPIKLRTSGSTFKNPTGAKAWELIDQAGCRGLAIGGAQVSTKHCNFFINNGDATAHDIEALGEEVRRRVKEKTGILLEWEVQIIGKEHE